MRTFIITVKTENSEIKQVRRTEELYKDEIRAIGKACAPCVITVRAPFEKWTADYRFE